jgi:hypothetical protein
VKEAERRRRVDLRCAPRPPMAGRTVVLVGDGLATGTTARAPCMRSSASTRHGSVSDGEVIALLDAAQSVQGTTGSERHPHPAD